MANVIQKLAHAWSIFGQTNESHLSYGGGIGYRGDRPRYSFTNDRSVINTIYTTMAVDVASFEIRHVMTDDQGRYLSDVNSGLNRCLDLESNIDQSGRALLQEVATTMFDRGVVAIVPTKTSIKPVETGSYDIEDLRVGYILDYYPQSIRVSVYNEATGEREPVVVPKRIAAIVENPYHSIMNEENSTLQRLKRKINLLDRADEDSVNGKLDIIVQMPYSVRSQVRQEQAEKRRSEIEAQLNGSKYGIAYMDGTEKITQLNRSAENNLPAQVADLTKQLYTQLRINETILDGTADEATMLNYMNRVIEPVVSAIVNELRRKFLTKNARTRGHEIMAFRDPFRFVPIEKMAEIGDKFTRNEITSSNEIRQAIGMKPSSDPKADELHNSNMPDQNDSSTEGESTTDAVDPAEGAIDEIDSMIDGILKDLAGATDDEDS